MKPTSQRDFNSKEISRNNEAHIDEYPENSEEKFEDLAAYGSFLFIISGNRLERCNFVAFS